MGKKSAREKWILGMGYWVQGMRCLPWMGVSFFLKDTLAVDPSTLQLLLNSVNLPMLAKPLFALLSDSNLNCRLLFISFAAMLQAVSWLAITIPSLSLATIATCLLISNVGASIAEVANDAIVAEASKGELQTFAWTASSAGGVVGNLLSGLIITRVAPQKIFVLFSLLASVQASIAGAATLGSSSGSNVPEGFSNRLLKLQLALRRPSVSLSIAWFAASNAAVPALTGTMFFYQTRTLGIGLSAIGLSKVVGQMAMVAWSAAYDRWLRRVPERRVIVGVQAAMSALMVSDVLFAKGFYRSFGVLDSAYVVLVSGVSEVMVFAKVLPFSVAVARLCPPGCEGSVMAVVSSAVSLSLIVSGYFGLVLAAALGVDSGVDFSGLPKGFLVQAVLTLLPLYWSSCIPNDGNDGDHDEQHHETSSKQD